MSAAEMSAVATAPAAPAVRRPRAVSTRFLRSELGMVFRRRRNLAILAVLAGIPIVIAIAIKVTAPPNDGTDGPPFLFSITGNGIFVALTALTVVLPLFLPLAVSVVAGESVAGEASLGTLRYLLVVPVSRTRLLAVKYAGALAYCLAAAFVVAVVGTVMGALLFPVGPVTLLSGTQVSYGGGPGPAAAGRALHRRDDGRPGRDRPVRLHADRVGDRGDGDHRRAGGAEPGAQPGPAARLAGTLAVQPLLARLRRPAARPDRHRRGRPRASPPPPRTC